MRQWRNGVGNAPRHYAGTRSATGCALSRTRSLTAAAVAVAMMATVAITSLIPAYNAKADENNLEDGSKCIPTSYTLGDDFNEVGEDTGVATYVGRDLYVGKNTNNSAKISDADDVDGSYAVEAEGLTVVNGKLVMKPLKDSWKARDSSGTYGSAGFRWGTVGFGSQFRPRGDGKTVLAIGGTNSGIDTLTSGGVQGNVGAYVKGGFVGQSFTQWDGNNRPTGPALGYKYKASIAGKETKWSSNTDRSSIVATQGDWKNDDNGDVTFNVSNPLKDVNGTDYTNYKDYLESKLSKPLSELQPNGRVDATGTAQEGNITRYKYNYPANPISFQFTYNGDSTTVDEEIVKNNEKLITFTGNNKSATQVFTLTSDQLSSIGYRGVDFKFVNIPKNASIVINVSGDDIDFHTGWRFWWNGLDIGGGFSENESKEIRELYSSAAQKIMWNFKDAKKVIIRGGVANESKNENDGNRLSKNTTDDPAAAMLGSILVPHGSFESHVSTNGRVYVGQDFMMYNPTAIGYVNDGAGWEGPTASVLNMDQERHNLPWNGQIIANCPAIQWKKANSAGWPLEGTTWKVYGTLEAAKTGTPSLGTITDGEFTDGNDDDGIIKFEGIERNAKYFVKEFATNSTEYTKVNPYIYQINTGNDENTRTDIVRVFNAKGNEITGTNADKKLTNSNQIINEKEGVALEWSKVDGSDNGKMLSGSEWQLQKNGSNKAYQITDSTKAVSAVTIQYDDVAAQSDDSTGSSTTSGADTTVYSCGDALGKCDMNTEPGKFRVVDLADGTYTLTETVAPNGYTAGGSYTVTIANGTATITDASGKAIAGNKIPNARNTGAILWNKVSSDSENDEKLGGSEWKLTKTESFGWNATTGKAEYTDIGIAQQQAITITDCKAAAGNKCTAPTDADGKAQTIYDVDPVEGQFKLEGLDWGTYTLEETKSPDGYDLDSTVRTFAFGPKSDSDGTGNWYSNSVAESNTDKTGTFTTADKTYDSDVFDFAVGGIKNQPGVVLPATGGEGNMKIFAAAIAAAMVAVVAACMALKVRRRQ